MANRSPIDVTCERLWVVAESARSRGSLSREDEDLERDLALGVMRSHFHHEYPKGTHCCVQCTLAVYPVLEARAIRYFDCATLSERVRRIVRTRQWRFARPVNAAMVQWSLGDR